MDSSATSGCPLQNLHPYPHNHNGLLIHKSNLLISNIVKQFCTEETSFVISILAFSAENLLLFF